MNESLLNVKQTIFFFLTESTKAALEKITLPGSSSESSSEDDDDDDDGTDDDDDDDCADDSSSGSDSDSDQGDQGGGGSGMRGRRHRPTNNRSAEKKGKKNKDKRSPKQKDPRYASSMSHDELWKMARAIQGLNQLQTYNMVKVVSEITGQRFQAGQDINIDVGKMTDEEIGPLKAYLESGKSSIDLLIKI